MNKYGQYCPMSRAVEILGDRWTLLIIRDLLYGVHHFCELERGLPGISRALLAERLRRLQQVGILERQVEATGHNTSYWLTPAGQELQPILEAFTLWGAKWAFGEPEPAELDPLLLLSWMRDTVITEQLPSQRIVVEFEFRGILRGNYWLFLKPGDVSVCRRNPGFEIDVLVKAELGSLYKVWAGYLPYSKAVQDQLIEVEAAPVLSQAFPNWFAWSPLAEIVRTVTPHRL